MLVEDGGVDWGTDDSPRSRALRDRVARLLSAIEQKTGAVVVGLAGSREQLLGWRFDRVIGGPPSIGAPIKGITSDKRTLHVTGRT